jgi:hypothetical protein
MKHVTGSVHDWIRIVSRKLMRSLIAGCFTALLVPLHARAQTIESTVSLSSTRLMHDPWHMSLPSCGDEAAYAVPAMSLALPSVLQQDGGQPPQADAQPLHAAAVEHSNGYVTRRKLHKYASFATLPLFATELALGQSLYNNPTTGSRRAAHAFVGAGIVGLFAVNTVTGAWNMFGEDRQDPEGGTLRLVHGLLMMAADVGFVATTMSGPNSRSPRQALTFASREATHRNLAIASISVATTSYLLMLLGNH